MASKRKRRPLGKKRRAAARPRRRQRFLGPSKGAGRYMVRFIGFLVGLVFAGVLLIPLIGGFWSFSANPPAPLPSDDFPGDPRALNLPSDAPLGNFDTR